MRCELEEAGGTANEHICLRHVYQVLRRRGCLFPLSVQRHACVIPKTQLSIRHRFGVKASNSAATSTSLRPRLGCSSSVNSRTLTASPPSFLRTSVVTFASSVAERRCFVVHRVWLVDTASGGISPSEVHGNDAFTGRNPRQVTRPSLEVLNSAELCAIAGETRG